jgi:hypothetical protein
MDARYARLGRLEGGAVGEISATYEGASARLMALADAPGKPIGRPSEVA